MTLTILQGEVEAKNTATYMEALRQTSALANPFFHDRRDDIKPTGLLGLGPQDAAAIDQGAA